MAEIDSLSLDEALTLVGEETRARIVFELGEAWDRAESQPAYLSFTELMDRLDIDDSGRFNYHLNKLVDTFVVKNDSEQGYALRVAGSHVYQALVAGTLTERQDRESIPVGDCPECDGELLLKQHPDNILMIECGDCESLVGSALLSPRGHDGRSQTAKLDAALCQLFHEISMLRRDTCPACNARVERDLREEMSEQWEETLGEDLWAQLQCTSCNTSVVTHPVRVLLTTPPVIGFYDEHGYDPVQFREWEAPLVNEDESTTVVDRDPLRVAHTFEVGGDSLRVVVNDDLQIVDTERESL